MIGSLPQSAGDGLALGQEITHRAIALGQEIVHRAIQGQKITAPASVRDRGHELADHISNRNQGGKILDQKIIKLPDVPDPSPEIADL